MTTLFYDKKINDRPVIYNIYTTHYDFIVLSNDRKNNK
jgi:hypothetical protein